MTETPPRLPTQKQIRLRARWLGSLDPEDRDRLGDLPLREIDRRFDRWREERHDDEPDDEPDDAPIDW